MTVLEAMTGGKRTYSIRFYTNSDGQYELLVCAYSEQEAAELAERHGYFGAHFPGGIHQIHNATDKQQLRAAENTARLTTASPVTP